MLTTTIKAKLGKLCKKNLFFVSTKKFNLFRFMNFRNSFENLFIYGLCILLLHEVYKRLLLVLLLLFSVKLEVKCNAQHFFGTSSLEEIQTRVLFIADDSNYFVIIFQSHVCRERREKEKSRHKCTLKFIDLFSSQYWHAGKSICSPKHWHKSGKAAQTFPSFPMYTYTHIT
jgi:hypothetical protein